nr:ribosomal protein S6 kinase alpha 6 [Hymenolepis microstoma]
MKQYALKRVLLQDAFSIRIAIRERQILERIANEKPNSLHLPTLHYSFIHGGSPILVMELFSQFTLTDILNNVFLLNTTDVTLYAAELVSGLEQIHSMQIAHLDLNEHNILLSQSGHLMITDFDRAIDLSVTQRFDHLDFSSNVYRSAPEIRNKIALTTKADIWALGCIVSAMVGRSIFKGNSLINVNGFIRWCLTPSYEDRPSAEQLKTHRFFQTVNWIYIERLQYRTPLLITSIPSLRQKPMDRLRRHLNYNSENRNLPIPSSSCSTTSTAIRDEQFLYECAFGQILTHIKYRQLIYISDDGTEVRGRSNHARTALARRDVQEEIRKFRNYKFVNSVLQVTVTQTEDVHSHQEN